MSAQRASRASRVLIGIVAVVLVAAALGPGAGMPVTRAAQIPCEHAGVPVTLDGAHLTLDDVVAIGRDEACVTMPASAMQRVQQSFDVLLEAAREDKPIYGLTRGVGENKDKTVFPGGQITAEGRALSETFNANLLRVQATATGPPARVEIVRAAMAIRLNAMLVGHTGVQVGVAQGLADFLNRGITPVVPTQGTVGEADIDLLAHVGLALMGEGDVFYGGRTVPAATALRDAGLRPVMPFGKDALSTFSSNAYSAAIAVFSTQDARKVLARARQIFALSMEGLNGNVAPFLAEVQQVRASPGRRLPRRPCATSFAGAIYTHWIPYAHSRIR